MNIEKNTDFINSNKEVENRSKIIPQREELIIINGNKEKKDKNTNSKEHSKNEIIINKSESSNNSNIENNSHKNNKDKNLIKNEKNFLLNYLKERKNYYSSKKYDTPILDKIIAGEMKITLNTFLKENPDKYKFEPYYPNLIKIIDIINSNDKFQKEILDEKTIGYICYKNKNNQCVEGIYSTLNNYMLYKEITEQSKFKKDDIYIDDPIISDNCFKTRGLSLEYYINCLLMNKFKQKELPRIIYHFLPDQKKNKKIKIKIKNLEELDGVFYLLKEEVLIINDLPFIVDDIYESDNSNFDFKKQKNNYIQFKEKSLVLLEVKNRLPETSYDSSEKEIIEKELKSELINLCDKVVAFYELYNEIFKDITKIRVILFYDLIPKNNYDEILSYVFKQYFVKGRLINIKNKIQLQCTFIISSYFAYTIKNFIDKTNLLELKINENKSKIESLKEKLQKIIEDDKYFKNIVNDFNAKFVKC